jgi:ribosome-binding factor A
MPKDFSRSARVAEVIQREVARIIQQGMNDPRATAVTITHATVTRDMSYARIYFIMQGDQQEIKEIEKVLNKASGFIRHELSSRVDLRHMPKLLFTFDESIERGMRLDKLIDDVMKDESGNS